MRALLLIVLGSGVFSLAGCPRGVETPDEPSMAAPCNSDEECTPEGSTECGLVWACVDGFCENDPSRTMPCE